MLNFYLYYKFMLEAEYFLLLNDKIQINFPKYKACKSPIGNSWTEMPIKSESFSQPFNFHLHMNFILAESADVYTATSWTFGHHMTTIMFLASQQNMIVLWRVVIEQNPVFHRQPNQILIRYLQIDQ